MPGPSLAWAFGQRGEHRYDSGPGAPPIVGRRCPRCGVWLWPEEESRPLLCFDQVLEERPPSGGLLASPLALRGMPESPIATTARRCMSWGPILPHELGRTQALGSRLVVPRCKAGRTCSPLR